MAKSNNNPYLPDLTRLVTQITTPQGDPVLNLTATDETTTDAQGRAIALKTSQAVTTVDGQILSAAQILGKVATGVCAFCRQPQSSWWRRETPTHGICTIANMTFCVDCHARLCPRHACVSGDQQIRCPGCNRKYARWALPRWLFTKRVRKG